MPRGPTYDLEANKKLAVKMTGIRRLKGVNLVVRFLLPNRTFLVRFGSVWSSNGLYFGET